METAVWRRSPRLFRCCRSRREGGTAPSGVKGAPKGFGSPRFLRLFIFRSKKRVPPKKVAKATSHPLTPTPPFSAKPELQQQLQPKTNEKGNTMPKRRKPPTEPFRRSQVVSPVPSQRRFGKAKAAKKAFDIYLTDLETGEESLVLTVYAFAHRDALKTGKERLQSSPLLRKITYAAFTAVEIEE